jgi:hypothetical protein
MNRVLFFYVIFCRGMCGPGSAMVKDLDEFPMILDKMYIKFEGQLLITITML